MRPALCGSGPGPAGLGEPPWDSDGPSPGELRGLGGPAGTPPGLAWETGGGGTPARAEKVLTLRLVPLEGRFRCDRRMNLTLQNLGKKENFSCGSSSWNGVSSSRRCRSPMRTHACGSVQAAASRSPGRSGGPRARRGHRPLGAAAHLWVGARPGFREENSGVVRFPRMGCRPLESTDLFRKYFSI